MCSPEWQGIELFCRASCGVYSASLSGKAPKKAGCGGTARVSGDGRFRVNVDLDQASHSEAISQPSAILNHKQTMFALQAERVTKKSDGTVSRKTDKGGHKLE